MTRADLRSEKTKYLMYPRVIRALEAMKISEDEFVKVYDALPDIRVKIPTADEVLAVEQFLKDGDLQALGEKVGRKESGSISLLVTRGLVLKARGAERIGREGWPSYPARAAQ